MAMMLLGLCGAALCVAYVADAMSSGQVVGRRGAHGPQSTEFRVGVAAACLGVLMGLACVVMGWRWFGKAVQARARRARARR